MFIRLPLQGLLGFDKFLLQPMRPGNTVDGFCWKYHGI